MRTCKPKDRVLSLQPVLEGAHAEDAQLQRLRRIKAIERFQRREEG